MFQPEQPGNGGTAEVVEEHGGPAESGGRKTQGGDGVSEVVLAVSKCPFAVFPGFPPVNGWQADKKRAERKSWVESAAVFEPVVATDIMVAPGG